MGIVLNGQSPWSNCCLVSCKLTISICLLSCFGAQHSAIDRHFGVSLPSVCDCVSLPHRVIISFWVYCNVLVSVHVIQLLSLNSLNNINVIFSDEASIHYPSPPSPSHHTDKRTGRKARRQTYIPLQSYVIKLAFDVAFSPY